MVLAMENCSWFVDGELGVARRRHWKRCAGWRNLNPIKKLINTGSGGGFDTGGTYRRIHHWISGQQWRITIGCHGFIEHIKMINTSHLVIHHLVSMIRWFRSQHIIHVKIRLQWQILFHAQACAQETQWERRVAINPLYIQINTVMRRREAMKNMGIAWGEGKASEWHGEDEKQQIRDGMQERTLDGDVIYYIQHPPLI